MKNKVVVGLSGGVDSSVAAYLLKEEGYEVIALFMINWHDTTGTLSGVCPWEEDRIMASLVAKKLDIPFHAIDLSEPYRKRVVEYMFAEYEKGRTPNPDVLCNREIKFDLFVEEAYKLNADYIATGHYCRRNEIEINGNIYSRLLTGVDSNKDQSYFLCQLSQKQLSNALFPIGNLLKPDVRKIAEDVGLATAKRKDSQGVCFVGKIDLPVFLQQKIKSKKGMIIEISKSFNGYNNLEGYGSNAKLKTLSMPYVYSPEDGTIVGMHNGAHFYTIGQRKGINVGGKAQPLFVIATDIENNIVYTGQGEDHPGLNRKYLFIETNDIHWVRNDKKLNAGDKMQYFVRIRYRQPLQKAFLHCYEEGIYIEFENFQKGISPGQFAVWYDGDELAGSGAISSYTGYSVVNNKNKIYTD